MSVVTYPAYESATSGIRTAENVEEARAALERWESEQTSEVDAVRVRLRKIKFDLEG